MNDAATRFDDSDNQCALSIDALQFGMLSPDEIRAYSVCEVRDPQQFENGRPVANGVFDLRMGSITRQLCCATCHRDKETCPGHFGHIELQVPVPHPMYIDQIREILNCVCYNCSELLVVKDAEFLKAIRSKTNPKTRAAFISGIVAKKSVRVCGFCGFNAKNRKRKEEFDEADSSKRRRVSQILRRAKPIKFSIGRGKERLERKPMPATTEQHIQGSGQLFSKALTDFAIDPVQMPKFEQLKKAEENSTASHGCLSIQPRFIHENTNLYMLWPESDQLYSFLLNGTTETEDDVIAEERIDKEENDNDVEEDNSTNEIKSSKKRKSLTDAAAKEEPVSVEKKRGRRKKIKDATTNDVRRLLKDRPFQLPSSIEPGQRELISSKQVNDILCRISPENCYLLGYDPLYSHPSWFMLTALPVIPPIARKLADLSHIHGSHIPLDDISFKLVQLIKKNNELAKQKNFRDTNFTQFQTLVTHHVMTLIDNKLRGQPVARRTPKAPPLESLTSHLKGKEGRIRKTMLGKRNDFSARGVVGPSKTLRSDQLGTPAVVARALTVPETVNRFNIEALQECVDRGPEAYRNGANYVCTPEGLRFNLSVRKNVALKIGYVVERHMQNNDVVVFNRQPSLHRMSMMGHRVKVTDQDNFTLNLSVTTPYNADFDGDEMNCHGVQSFVGRVEIRELMMVPSQFISPQNNAPIIGLIQDVLLAIQLFTERDTFLTQEEVFQILMFAEHEDDCCETKEMLQRKLPQYRLPKPAILKPQPLWTGKQILSLLLPEDLIYEKRSRAFTEYKQRLQSVLKASPVAATYCDPSDTFVVVKNGELLSGVLDKNSLGASTGSFVHIVCNDHGGQRARDMIDAIARCMTMWLVEHGFSVGIEDMVLTKEQRETIAKIKRVAQESAEQLSRDLTARCIDEIPGKSMEDTFEYMVNKNLNTCRDEIGIYVQQSLSMRNRVKKMEKAGSKGNLINLASISGGIGQNNVNGRRLEQVYYGRSTPHALPTDKSDIEGRGFISGCYLDGIPPLQFFNHHMGGREGLVHTAVKTSDTGYIQRKLINILADLTVTYSHHTVRNATGNIVQFAYGEDTMDGTRIEKQSFDFLKYDDCAMLNKYYVGEPLCAEQCRAILFPQRSIEACEQLIAKCNFFAASYQYRQQQEALVEIKFLFEARDYLRKYVFANEFRKHLYLPKNLKRLVERSKQKFGSAAMQAENIADVRVVLSGLLNCIMDSVNGYKNNASHDESSLYSRYNILLPTVELDNNTSSKHSIGTPHTELLTAIFIHYYLSPKRAIFEHKLSIEALQWVCSEYAREFCESRIHPGEAVGPVAAQSIGEPSTQMTLNTFHFAGVSDVDVTLGLPRLKELIAAAKNIQTPVTTVKLLPKWRGTAGEFDITKKIAAQMPLVLLENLLLNSQVVYEDDKLPLTKINRDQQFLQAAFDNYSPLREQANGGLSPWCIRFVLNRETLVERQYCTSFVAACLTRHIADWATVIASDDNDCVVGGENVKDGGVVRVYLLLSPIEKELDWQKPDKSSMFDPTSLDDVTDEQWKFACCEQYAEQAMQFCTTLKIAGIDGICGAVPRKANIVEYCSDTGAVVEGVSEWSINTQGTNLAEILTMEGVDHTRTICNHALEVQKVLGIEAARAVLLEEFRKVLSFQDTYVDYRHLALLVDTMTAGGQVAPVSRHAFRKQPTGPYTRAAFEQQTDVLCDAAIFAEYEDGNDMRAAIMMGKRIPQGTGSMFDTLLSLDTVVQSQSKTMNEFVYEREQKSKESARMPKNPFGFTGIREEKPNIPEHVVSISNTVVAVTNPFFTAQHKPILDEKVYEKQPSTIIPFECRIPQTILPRYRPRSPSRYLQ